MFVVLVTDATTTSEDDDTFSSYIGFNNIASMPMPLSNTVAVLFKKSETVASSVSKELTWKRSVAEAEVLSSMLLVKAIYIWYATS